MQISTINFNFQVVGKYNTKLYNDSLFYTTYSKRYRKLVGSQRVNDWVSNRWPCHSSRLPVCREKYAFDFTRCCIVQFKQKYIYTYIIYRCVRICIYTYSYKVADKLCSSSDFLFRSQEQVKYNLFLCLLLFISQK